MTYNDETLRERYQREHAEHLARLAALTPEQIDEMIVSHHNAMAAADSLRTDLLGALEACLDYGSLTGAEWVLDKARAAISRARGEE